MDSVDTQTSNSKPFYQNNRFWLIVLCVIFAIFILRYWFVATHKKQHVDHAQSVVAAIAHTKEVPVTVTALGTVTAASVVTVKTQVNGHLQRLAFTEGQMVKVGDLLAEIDPRPFEAQILQYQGQLARDEALLENSRLDLKRYKKLWAEDSVAKQTYDTQAALVRQYEGNVALDKGLLQGVAVNLGYTRITSPVNGRIGLNLVDAGNYVQTSDTTGIAVITTLDPINIVFPIPEEQIAVVMEKLNAGKKLEVKAYNRAQDKLLATGVLETVDNQIDTTTGTVKLKALFNNPHYQLFPNQFVNVSLVVDILKNALVIPTAAIQYGVKDPFVYLIKSDHTVMVKPVILGVTYGVDTVILKGLSLGDQVVTEGADKLTEGSEVILPEENGSQNSQRKKP